MSNNARNFSPAAHGLTTSIVGPSGSGKSRFAATAVKHITAAGGKAFAVLAPAAELASYSGLDLEYEILMDPDFDSIGHVQAGAPMVSKALGALKKTLEEIRKRDDIGLLIFDTANAGLSTAVWHAVLAQHGIARPQEGRNPFGPYQMYPLWMQELINKIDLLRYTKKMHVIYLWHQAMKELEGHGKMRKEQVEGKWEYKWDDAMQVEAHGRVVAPMIPRWSDLFFYSEPLVETKDGKKDFRCRLVALPDEIRLPKTRLPEVMKRFQVMPEIPNDFGVLMGIVEEAYRKGGAP